VREALQDTGLVGAPDHGRAEASADEVGPPRNAGARRDEPDQLIEIHRARLAGRTVGSVPVARIAGRGDPCVG
jgi:hypothetical protein